MTEASATFSAFVGFEGSLRSLLDFLFSLKQCVPTAAVSLSALAYELAHELAVAHLCTVRVAYMVYLARLFFLARLYVVGLRAMVAAWWREVFSFSMLCGLFQSHAIQACMRKHVCLGS